MLSIIKRNSDQNYNELPPHTGQNGHHQKNLQAIHDGKVWEKETLLHYEWECKLVQPLWRTVWKLLKTLKIELPHDPAIPLLGIHPDRTII